MYFWDPEQLVVRVWWELEDLRRAIYLQTHLRALWCFVRWSCLILIGIRTVFVWCGIGFCDKWRGNHFLNCRRWWIEYSMILLRRMVTWFLTVCPTKAQLHLRPSRDLWTNRNGIWGCWCEWFKCDVCCLICDVFDGCWLSWGESCCTKPLPNCLSWVREHNTGIVSRRLYHGGCTTEITPRRSYHGDYRTQISWEIWVQQKNSVQA